eukprot:5858987-Prorocentrum_lima.AAC.1
MANKQVATLVTLPALRGPGGECLDGRLFTAAKAGPANPRRALWGSLWPQNRDGFGPKQGSLCPP